MKKTQKISLVNKKRFALINILLVKQRNFLLFIVVCFLTTGVFYPYPAIAMWIGFGLAAFSAVANDSIQTIGTFISSNSDRKWWVLWIYIGSIFIGTVVFSWIVFDGDVTFQRLESKGFSEAPTSFHFLQVAAPIFLIILTRLRMPVSTTFLLLSSFTTSAGAVGGVLQKSITGYLVAFVLALVIWILLDKPLKRLLKGKAHTGWLVFQWSTSGALWALWIMQDAANIAVFLPRSLSAVQLVAFCATVVFGLGITFYLKGDQIQQVVDEKSDVKDIRAATVIDLVYVMILIVFTWINTVPMSTTWVFIGLLGGRELGIKIRKQDRLAHTWKLIAKDLMYAVLGLVVSIAVALAANEHIRNQIFE